MLRTANHHRRPQYSANLAAYVAAALFLLSPQTVQALIEGGTGNEPLRDPGWPQGAAEIFNHPGRVAHWVGPPFGGGQWHAECRGDAVALNKVLADFTKLDAKTKRIVVHDGVGHSFWLNPNGEPAKEEAARVDWAFTVWQPASWERLKDLPADLNPIAKRDAAGGPPAQIDVYTGGSIRWADVVVPHGIDVGDERLEAHGLALADGAVLEGTVVDLATQQPVAARVRLERYKPRPEGGYEYATAAETTADSEGRWVIKNAPAGSHRIVVEADGYVPRLAGYANFDQPGWHAYECALARPAVVSGRVTDDVGRPLADVEVHLGDVSTAAEGRYQSPHEFKTKTDNDGRFRLEQVPVGSARVWVRKPGFVRPGLGPTIETPKDDVELSMSKSARVEVTVDFAATTRPNEYIVEIEPEGGSVVGSWGGSAQIDAKNKYSFAEVPPGRYILKGRPNPGSESQQTEPITVDLQGGQVSKVTLTAK